MKFSEAVKPISYFKAHASEVIRDVVDNQKTMIITQNGEAKVVLQDVHVYEQLQESLALLKMLALSTKKLNNGAYKSAENSFQDMRSQLDKRNN